MSPVIDQCNRLARIGYFGGEDVFKPLAWLQNFRAPEKPYAEAILESLIYINQAQVRALVKDAISSLSTTVYAEDDGGDCLEAWNSFLRNASLVGVSDPLGSGGESSAVYTRIAKKTLLIPDNQILEPSSAIERAAASTENIVFIDDIVGSGQQFADFWRHKWVTSSSSSGERPRSFADVAEYWSELDDSYAKPQFFYVPIVAHETGLSLIESQFPSVTVLPVYKVDNAYSAKNPDSIIWNGRFSSHQIEQFVTRTSRRAGIQGNIWGHESLGLCIALETGIPDFTLPLLTHEAPSWVPLFKNI